MTQFGGRRFDGILHSTRLHCLHYYYYNIFNLHKYDVTCYRMANRRGLARMLDSGRYRTITIYY